MTKKTYLEQPHVTSGIVTVAALIPGEKPVVRLAETWFHAQGGGQKADIGTIGPVRVLGVQHAEEKTTVDHYVDTLDGLEVGKSYPFQVDPLSRQLNTVYHTAAHLIAAVAETQFPAIRAVAGHQWPGEARVEFEGVFDDALSAALLEYLASALPKAIAEDWPCTMVGNPYTDRALQIANTEAVPCGGTHVPRLSEIGSITVKTAKRKGDRLRLNYEATVAA